MKNKNKAPTRVGIGSDVVLWVSVVVVLDPGVGGPGGVEALLQELVPHRVVHVQCRQVVRRHERTLYVLYGGRGQAQLGTRPQSYGCLFLHVEIAPRRRRQLLCSQYESIFILFWIIGIVKVKFSSKLDWFTINF